MEILLGMMKNSINVNIIVKEKYQAKQKIG